VLLAPGGSAAWPCWQIYGLRRATSALAAPLGYSSNFKACAERLRIGSTRNPDEGLDLLATEMTTADVPAVYWRLASAIGPEHWQGAVGRQEEAIRLNHFLGDYLRSEYAIAYQLEKLRTLAARFGAVPYEACNDRSIFPALAFAAQVFGVLNLCTKKQARAFVRRVRTAFSSAENMHGLRLELQAATHFTRRGRQVLWHRANGGGSFDLLVEDLGTSGLEVECKSISDDKGRKIHRREAIDFWGGLWRDISGVAKNLRSGLAVVLTVPYRLPADPADRKQLAREVVTQIIAGNAGMRLNDGTEIRIKTFDHAPVGGAIADGRHALRRAIDEATGTDNREAVLYGTPAGGLLTFVLQSAVPDDVLNQVFATLTESAANQFSMTRGAFFWVALQGLDADQLMSVHVQDSDRGQQPTGLRRSVSDFLAAAPEHVVGVVFGSRSGLLPREDGTTDSDGATNFFLKEESLHWHPSFRGPLLGP